VAYAGRYNAREAKQTPGGGGGSRTMDEEDPVLLPRGLYGLERFTGWRLMLLEVRSHRCLA